METLPDTTAGLRLVEMNAWRWPARRRGLYNVVKRLATLDPGNESRAQGLIAMYAPLPPDMHQERCDRVVGEVLDATKTPEERAFIRRRLAPRGTR